MTMNQEFRIHEALNQGTSILFVIKTLFVSM